MMKHKEIKERIREVIKHEGGNASALARRCNLNPNELQSILHTENKSAINQKLMIGLVEMGVDINWVLTGKMNEWEIKAKKCEEKLTQLLFYIEQLERLLKPN